MPRYHRTDETGRPTDRSLLADGYPEPDRAPNMLALAMALLPISGLLWWGFFSLLKSIL